MSSPSHKVSLAQCWIDKAAGWIAAVRENRIESRRLATDKAVIEAILALAPQRVLDMGCGEGWLVRKLETYGIEAIGMDASLPVVASAQAAGGRILHLSYDEIIGEPKRAGGTYDALVFNFALLGQDVIPLLRATTALLSEKGRLIIQTVHPWSACGHSAYADGWRTETFDLFGSAFPSPMPWYYRTLSSWIATINDSGYRVVSRHEPLHPQSRKPVSLLLIASPHLSSTFDQGRQA